MDPFWKCISRWPSNGKTPKHKVDLFIHVKGLLYKHITDSHIKFLALVIPKAWKYTVLVETHDKLGHQGTTQTYCLIKCQYYWKGMNKDIRKYITQCVLCHREKAKVHTYPLQMTDILECPFDKITIIYKGSYVWLFPSLMKCSVEHESLSSNNYVLWKTSLWITNYTTEW